MRSDWEIVSFAQDGTALPDGLVTPSEIRLELRRNWLYVHDEVAWLPGAALPFPVVMTVESGELQYRDVRIHATRGPQDGIYVVAHYARYPDPTSDVAGESRWMFGCGVYGHRRRAVSDDHVCRRCEHLRRTVEDWDPQDCPVGGQSVHVGVEPASLRFLQDYIRTRDFTDADLLDAAATHLHRDHALPP